MSDSILEDIKLALGIPAEYTAYDPTIIMHINSAIGYLTDVGVGPAQGFMIVDAAATWSQFLGPNFSLNKVKTYMTLQVKMWWDPPTTGYAIGPMQQQIDQALWRASVNAELAPFATTPETPIILDGGN